MFKHCGLFIGCVEIDNAQVNNAKEIYVVLPTYNLIVHCDNFWKASWKLWQHFIDESAVNKCSTTEFDANNATTDSFKPKEKITRKAGNNGTTDVEIMILLKCLSNFCRTLQMPLINCEINFILTWSVCYKALCHRSS